MTPVTAVFSPQVGDNVYARWDGNKWYLAHVTAIVHNSYEVYFVEDGETKKDLLLVDLRPAPLTPVGLGSMTREMLVTQHAQWWFEGADDLPAGHWMVQSVVDNDFVCVRMTGGGPGVQKVERFDIGYVMYTINQTRERIRQR